MTILHEYGTLTVKDIVEIIQNNPKLFPKGLDTEIALEDYEGNYTHNSMGVDVFYETPHNRITLSYELHD